MEQKTCEYCHGPISKRNKRFCSIRCNVAGNSAMSHRGEVIKPLVDRFWEKVDRRGPDECWPWKGAVDKWGYGILYRTRLPKVTWYKSNRLAYEIQIGPIPPKMQSLHKCDNPPCCNGRHLYPGTHQKNMQDRAERKRGKEHRQQGEHNDNAKLTEADVRAIIEELKKLPRRSQQSIAQQFGIGQAQVSRIMLRTQWKHLWEE